VECTWEATSWTYYVYSVIGFICGRHYETFCLVCEIFHMGATLWTCFAVQFLEGCTCGRHYKQRLPSLLTVHYLLTYLLTSRCRILFENLSKNIPPSYGTRRFITVFITARHRTLSWASRIQFAPSIPISLRSTLILSSHLCVGLPSSLFPSGLPTKTL